jgi:hypothetical protein
MVSGKPSYDIFLWGMGALLIALFFKSGQIFDSHQEAIDALVMRPRTISAINEQQHMLQLVSMLKEAKLNPEGYAFALNYLNIFMNTPPTVEEWRGFLEALADSGEQDALARLGDKLSRLWGPGPGGPGGNGPAVTP